MSVVWKNLTATSPSRFFLSLSYSRPTNSTSTRKVFDAGFMLNTYNKSPIIEVVVVRVFMAQWIAKFVDKRSDCYKSWISFLHGCSVVNFSNISLANTFNGSWRLSPQYSLAITTNREIALGFSGICVICGHTRSVNFQRQYMKGNALLRKITLKRVNYQCFLKILNSNLLFTVAKAKRYDVCIWKITVRCGSNTSSVNKRLKTFQSLWIKLTNVTF